MITLKKLFKVSKATQDTKKPQETSDVTESIRPSKQVVTEAAAQPVQPMQPVLLLKRWATACIKAEAKEDMLNFDDKVRSLCLPLEIKVRVLRDILDEKNSVLNTIIFLNLVYLISNFKCRCSPDHQVSQEIKKLELLAEEIVKENEKKKKKTDVNNIGLIEKRFLKSKYHVDCLLDYKSYKKSKEPISPKSYIYVKIDKPSWTQTVKNLDDSFRNIEERMYEIMKKSRRHSL